MYLKHEWSKADNFLIISTLMSYSHKGRSNESRYTDADFRFYDNFMTANKGFVNRKNAL